MSQPIIRWLRQLFTQVQDVRSATHQPDSSVIFRNHTADLVVQTWMGARLYLHLINQPVKIRELKSILKDNSRGSIGTLFLVRHDLLPANGADACVDDWIEALQLLYDSFVYSYKIVDGMPILSQVHFTPGRYAGQWACWHNDDFEIQTVLVRRRTITDTIKGDWYVGDIATPQYKRQINYERTQQHFHYRTKYTGQVNRRRRVPTDRLQQCYDLLGVDHSATRSDVKKAYRKLAMQHHPDVSSSAREEAEQRIKEINVAYEFIKNYHDWN